MTAVKFTIADQPQPVDALLKGCIGRGQGVCPGPLAAPGFQSCATLIPSPWLLLCSLLLALKSETAV